MSAEDDVRSFINSLSLGVAAFCGPTRPAEPPAVLNKAIFIQETGGPPAEPYMDGTRSSYRFMRVQVRVRGEPNDYQTTRDLAKTIWSNLQQSSTPMTGSYVRVTCDQSNPFYMGRDAYQNHEWVVNLTLEKRLF